MAPSSNAKLPRSTRTRTAKGRTKPITLGVRGYKSLRDPVAVELRPLTLLSGRNSSGKSSLMQPLLLLKQTLEASYDHGPLRLDGPIVPFSEVRQLFWQGKRRNDRALEFGVAVESEGRCEFVFGHDKEGKLRLDREEIRSTAGRSRTIGEGIDNLRLTRVLAKTPQLAPRAFALQLVEGMLHVPGLRGHPERFYPVSGIGDRFPGRFHPYTATILAHWMSDKDERLSTVAEQLLQLGLTWKVEARRLDDTRLEVRVARTYKSHGGGAKDLVNIADVGFGVSQVLPVLVALLTAKKGDVVHLEQPSLHLHPAAQASLAQPLADAAKRGVIVVAETHSPLLLRSVQEMVAAGSLPATDVALHWFRRDDTGVTQVTTADLHRDGSYGDWPEDFDDTALELETRLITAMAGL